MRLDEKLTWESSPAPSLCYRSLGWLRREFGRPRFHGAPQQHSSDGHWDLWTRVQYKACHYVVISTHMLASAGKVMWAVPVCRIRFFSI
jgi:hypothetical protein